LSFGSKWNNIHDLIKLDADGSHVDRRRRIDQCHGLAREIGSPRAAIGKQDRFAEQAELNTQLKELKKRLARTKAGP
jgi:transcription elongation GreA/GreB family factor